MFNYFIFVWEYVMIFIDHRYILIFDGLYMKLNFFNILIFVHIRINFNDPRCMNFLMDYDRCLCLSLYRFDSTFIFEFLFINYYLLHLLYILLE
jgi:hypothetical protein